MTNRLSHSQAMKFVDCSKSWEYHYRHKIRPTVTSSALLFGNILDVAVGVYLQNRNKEEAFRYMYEKWEKQPINDVEKELFSCLDIVYSNSDYDEELLKDSDKDKLARLYGEGWQGTLKAIYDIKSSVGYANLKDDDKRLLNNANWFSMLRKGEYMLEKAIQVLDENVEEVLGTQVKVTLANEEGDEIVGYADFVVKWKGYEGRPIVLDLKTSAKAYEDDSVLTSPQLSLYVHDLQEKFGSRYAGFFVLHKTIRKNRNKVCSVCGFDGTGGRHKTCNNEVEGNRCGGEWSETISPEATHQIIINEIPERLEEIVIENMDAVNNSIKTGIYPRNFAACEKPWGSCPYKDLCFKNKTDGLIVKD